MKRGTNVCKCSAPQCSPHVQYIPEVMCHIHLLNSLNQVQYSHKTVNTIPELTSVLWWSYASYFPAPTFYPVMLLERSPHTTSSSYSNGYVSGHFAGATVAETGRLCGESPLHSVSCGHIPCIARDRLIKYT